MSCENCEESAYVIDKLAKLLAEIAVIVNGPEPPLTRWSYHDLPEKVRALKEAQQPAAAVAVPDWLPQPGESEYVGDAGPVTDADFAEHPAAAVPEGYAPVPVEPTTMAFALPDGKYALYTAPPPRRNVTYVCPVCAASLERQE